MLVLIRFNHIIRVRQKRTKPNTGFLIKPNWNQMTSWMA